MWGFVKSAFNVVAGLAHTVRSGIKALINFTLGLPEFALSMLGVYPPKKVGIACKILVDEDRNPLADRRVMQTALELADATFRAQMNVRVVPLSREPSIVPEIPPGKVLRHSCWPGAFMQTATEAGRWLRRHSATMPIRSQLGWGAPVTVFVIADVTGGKNGCSSGMLADYVVIDPRGLTSERDEEGTRLTLAHEVGHACRLVLHKDGTLMNKDDNGRSRRLSRLQKAMFRSSGHVSYFQSKPLPNCTAIAT